MKESDFSRCCHSIIRLLHHVDGALPVTVMLLTLFSILLSIGCGETGVNPFGGPDLSPPQILSIDTDGSVLNVTTDEPAVIRVDAWDDYGKTWFFSYGCHDSDYSKAFEIPVFGMDEGKSYNISVILTDMAGNESRSDDFRIVSDGSVAGLLDITMINVGWGDSHLIITPSGTKILIDGGADGKLAGITSYLDRKGVSGVDHMVLTHLHWDHYWGLTNYLIGALHSPDLYDAEPHAPSYTGSWADREIQDILDLYGIEEVNPSDGEFLDWDDDVTFRVLCSGNKWPSEDNENHSSIVIMVTLDDFDMILSGDAEFPNEDFMRSRYGSALKAEVLKVGHHGNDDATSPEYVSVVSPIAALIPVDPADVDNAMPDLSVMNILKDAGTDIFCSYSAVPYENDDEVPGNVEVLTDGKTFTIKVMATN